MSALTGLNSKQVKKRIEEFGHNEISSQKPKSIFNLLLKMLAEPMIFLLVATGFTYLLLGEPKDSIALFSTIVIVISITLYQEKRTENAVQALKDLSSPRALVIREGSQIRIPGREVVVDDILLLNEGDRVSADGIIVDSLNLSVDESLLTGESLAVHKVSISKAVQKSNNLDNDIFSSENMVYSGTMVTQGTAVVKVSSTGMNTKMGSIGKALKSVKEEEFLLKKEITKIIKVFFFFGILACILLFLINYYLYQDFLNSLLSGLTLAIAMLPEEFPLVLIIFLTLGAYRISKKNVLARNNQAIETLGATSVLCVDKTGTLTYNKMELSGIYYKDKFLSFENKIKKIATNFEKLLFISNLASKQNPVDPLEQELNSVYSKYFPNKFNELTKYELLKEYPLTKDLFVISRIYNDINSKNKLITAKGSPEHILKLCNLDKYQKQKVLEHVQDLASKGKRVLAVASCTYCGSLKKSLQNYDFEYLGLLSFSDNIRKNVKHSVDTCYKAGIRVIMITGDYPKTAQYIAQKAGIKNIDNYLTGSDLEDMSMSELRETIKNVNIFARIIPEQKLKIVKALKANNEVVAMTGDGVNDGPALKSANIGVSMGLRGTDVARESSDLVLLDDNFNSIVSAITLGRRIYDNIKKAVSYIFSLHIPIAGVALIPLLFGLPPILYPIHIAFFEFIIDPAYSAVFESYPGDKNLMKRKPRDINKALFRGSNLAIALLQGVVILITTMLIYIVSFELGYSEYTSRGMAFTALVIGNLLLVLSNLSSNPIVSFTNIYINKAFIILCFVVIAVITTYLNNSFVQDLFKIESLNILQLLLVIITALFTFIMLELVKIFKRFYK